MSVVILNSRHWQSLAGQMYMCIGEISDDVWKYMYQ